MCFSYYFPFHRFIVGEILLLDHNRKPATFHDFEYFVVSVGLPIQPFPEWYEHKIHSRENLIKTTSLEECERVNILIEIEILY